MKQARIRTESMVERFSRKSIGEGYELWDRDYPLGALRLFIFKSESAAPFQVASCLDAIAEISLQMNGMDDAQEQFALAAERYKMLQQPILSELMTIKGTELTQGTVAAQQKLRALLANYDPKDGDVRQKSALARCYAYLSELVLRSASEEEESAVAAEAVDAASKSVDSQWDRAHRGYFALADAYEAAGDLVKAEEAYQGAIRMCPHFVEALERLIDVTKHLHAESEDTSEEAVAQRRQALMNLVEQAIEAHPRGGFLREKAFLLSESKGDAAALAYLEDVIEHPPLEEAESIDTVGGKTQGILHKAKAAILADGDRLAEALEAAKKAVEANPSDEEAIALVSDIQEAMQS